MKLKLDFDFPSLPSTLKHGDDIVLLGSCFSDSMSGHFQFAGFDVLSNPFGTLFHPIAIANTINASLSESEEVAYLKRDDVYLSWDSGSKVFGYNQDDLITSVIEQRTALRNKLSNAKLLVVTFGTSWGYRHNELDQLVGNCHKEPSKTFHKELSSIEELYSHWSELIEKIKVVNPSIEIVLTVSPVRHIKDGLIENNRSKARLIELTHQLTGDQVSYFPSYEILVDELRDYRFYTNDLVHPSDQAVAFIWEKFKDFAFEADSMALIEKVEKIKALLSHRSIHPESQVDLDRIEKGIELKSQLAALHPEIYWA